MAKDKTKLLDEEKHLRRKVEEEYDGMKRKWDMLSQGENPAEDELKKECEDLRVSPSHIFFFFFLAPFAWDHGAD